MKNIFAAVALAALVFAVVNTPRAEAAAPVAEVAADMALGAAKWQVNLTTDGGATGVTQVACLSSINQTLLIQSNPTANLPAGPEYCYKTCPTITCVPDCTKDFRPITPRTEVEIVSDGGTASGLLRTSYGPPTSEPISMGQDKCIAASSLDAGALQLRVYYVTKNPGQ